MFLFKIERWTFISSPSLLDIPCWILDIPVFPSVFSFIIGYSLLDIGYSLCPLCLLCYSPFTIYDSRPPEADKIHD